MELEIPFPPFPIRIRLALNQVDESISNRIKRVFHVELLFKVTRAIAAPEVNDAMIFNFSSARCIGFRLPSRVAVLLVFVVDAGGIERVNRAVGVPGNRHAQTTRVLAAVPDEIRV